jgi:hypothetical protein
MQTTQQKHMERRFYLRSGLQVKRKEMRTIAQGRLFGEDFSSILTLFVLIFLSSHF